jgi:hypothetical protein
MLHKRLSRFSWTFSIPQILAVLSSTATGDSAQNNQCDGSCRRCRSLPFGYSSEAPFRGAIAHGEGHNGPPVRLSQPSRWTGCWHVFLFQADAEFFCCRRGEHTAGNHQHH